MIEFNNPFQSNAQPLKLYAATSSAKAKEDQSKEKSGNPAAQVTISRDAYDQYSALRNLTLRSTSDEDGHENKELLKLFRETIARETTEEAREQRRLENLEKQQASANLHPLENEFQIYGVKYGLTEGTIEHTIASALEGKVVNPSLYAVQLAEAIHGDPYSDQSIEERTIQREIALQQAQYVADNYFDNEEDAQSFLAEIKKYAENAVLSERGYFVHEGKTYRNYSGPLESNGGVSFSVLAKRYMDEEYYERFMNRQGTVAESTKFLMDIQKNETKYRNEIAAEFNAEEKVILEQMNHAKKLVSGITWDNNNFVETIESVLQNLGYDDLAKWNRNMLKLFL